MNDTSMIHESGIEMRWTTTPSFGKEWGKKIKKPRSWPAVGYGLMIYESGIEMGGITSSLARGGKKRAKGRVYDLPLALRRMNALYALST